MRDQLASNDATNRELAAYLLLVRGEKKDVADYYIGKLKDKSYRPFDLRMCSCAARVRLSDGRTTDVVVRQAVVPISCLGRLAIAPLVALLSNEDVEVRGSAISALRSITGMKLPDSEPGNEFTKRIAELLREHGWLESEKAESGPRD